MAVSVRGLLDSASAVVVCAVFGSVLSIGLLSACDDDSEEAADTGSNVGDTGGDTDVADEGDADVTDVEEDAGPTVLAVAGVADLTDLIGVESADADSRPGGPAVIELAAGVYELTEPLLLPPGWELHGTNEYVDEDEDGVWDSRSEDEPVFADPDNETIIDATITIDGTAPWRVASCPGETDTWMPHPAVLYSTGNVISGITFVRGSAYVGPAGGEWLELDERTVTVTDSVLLGGITEDENAYPYPDVHIELGAVGCSADDHPVEIVSNLEGNVLVGGFWCFMVFNRSTASGSTARATIERNRTIECSHGILVGSGIDGGIGVVESGGNILSNGTSGLSVVGGADAPAPHCRPYGTPIDTDDDDVPDEADADDGHDPTSLDGLTGVDEADATGPACPDADYVVVDFEPDGTPDLIEPIRLGGRNSETTVESTGDTFSGNTFGAFAASVRHGITACSSTGNSIDLTVVEGTFTENLNLDLLVAGGFTPMEGSVEWMTDNETHVTLQDSSYASCMVRDSYWVAGEDDFDCTAHAEASPDEYGNDAIVTIETE